MPYYGRRYNKSRYRKFRKSKKRTFSRFNTYKNRSSKHQAYQIYSLNKKIRGIERRTKPELIQEMPPAYTATVSFTTASNSWYTTAGQAHFTQDSWLQHVDQDEIRINKLIVYGAFERESGTEGGPIDTKASGFARIAILQTKQEKSTLLTPSSIFHSSEGTLDYRAPLMKGASTQDRILAVINLALTDEQLNMRTFKASIPLKRPLYRKPTASTGYGLGYLYAVCMFYTDGLATNVRYHLNMRSKVLYTDA